MQLVKPKHGNSAAAAASDRLGDSKPGSSKSGVGIVTNGTATMNKSAANVNSDATARATAAALAKAKEVIRSGGSQAEAAAAAKEVARQILKDAHAQQNGGAGSAAVLITNPQSNSPDWKSGSNDNGEFKEKSTETKLLMAKMESSAANSASTSATAGAANSAAGVLRGKRSKKKAMKNGSSRPPLAPSAKGFSSALSKLRKKGGPAASVRSKKTKSGKSRRNSNKASKSKKSKNKGKRQQQQEEGGETMGGNDDNKKDAREMEEERNANKETSHKGGGEGMTQSRDEVESGQDNDKDEQNHQQQHEEGNMRETIDQTGLPATHERDDSLGTSTGASLPASHSRYSGARTSSYSSETTRSSDADTGTDQSRSASLSEYDDYSAQELNQSEARKRSSPYGGGSSAEYDYELLYHHGNMPSVYIQQDETVSILASKEMDQKDPNIMDVINLTSVMNAVDGALFPVDAANGNSSGSRFKDIQSSHSTGQVITGSGSVSGSGSDQLGRGEGGCFWTMCFSGCNNDKSICSSSETTARSSKASIVDDGQYYSKSKIKAKAMAASMPSDPNNNRNSNDTGKSVSWADSVDSYSKDSSGMAGANAQRNFNKTQSHDSASLTALRTRSKNSDTINSSAEGGTTTFETTITKEDTINTKSSRGTKSSNETGGGSSGTGTGTAKSDMASISVSSKVKAMIKNAVNGPLFASSHEADAMAGAKTTAEANAAAMNSGHFLPPGRRDISAGVVAPGTNSGGIATADAAAQNQQPNLLGVAANVTAATREGGMGATGTGNADKSGNDDNPNWRDMVADTIEKTPGPYAADNRKETGLRRQQPRQGVGEAGDYQYVVNHHPGPEKPVVSQVYFSSQVPLSGPQGVDPYFSGGGHNKNIRVGPLQGNGKDQFQSHQGSPAQEGQFENSGQDRGIGLHQSKVMMGPDSGHSAARQGSYQTNGGWWQRGRNNQMIGPIQNTTNLHGNENNRPRPYMNKNTNANNNNAPATLVAGINSNLSAETEEDRLGDRYAGMEQQRLQEEEQQYNNLNKTSDQQKWQQKGLQQHSAMNKYDSSGGAHGNINTIGEERHQNFDPDGPNGRYNENYSGDAPMNRTAMNIGDVKSGKSNNDNTDPKSPALMLLISDDESDLNAFRGEPVTAVDRYGARKSTPSPIHEDIRQGGDQPGPPHDSFSRHQVNVSPRSTTTLGMSTLSSQQVTLSPPSTMATDGLVDGHLNNNNTNYQESREELQGQQQQKGWQQQLNQRRQQQQNQNQHQTQYQQHLQQSQQYEQQQYQQPMLQMHRHDSRDGFAIEQRSGNTMQICRQQHQYQQQHEQQNPNLGTSQMGHGQMQVLEGNKHGSTRILGGLSGIHHRETLHKNYPMQPQQPGDVLINIEEQENEIQLQDAPMNNRQPSPKMLSQFPHDALMKNPNINLVNNINPEHHHHLQFNQQQQQQSVHPGNKHHHQLQFNQQQQQSAHPSNKYGMDTNLYSGTNNIKSPKYHKIDPNPSSIGYYDKQKQQEQQPTPIINNIDGSSPTALPQHQALGGDQMQHMPATENQGYRTFAA